MIGKRILAGLLTVAMVGASLATPGNTLQTEAAAKPLTKISITKKATVYVGATKQLKVTKTPKNTTAKITWKSSNKKVATVTQKGVVKGVKAGSAKITASGKGKNNKTLKATCKVTVKKPVLIKQLKTDFTKATLEVGKTKTIKTMITPKNASVKELKYKSSNTKVATVNSKGKVTAKKAGKATITVSTTDGSKKKVSIQITVKAKSFQAKVSEITVQDSDIALVAGKTQKLKTTIVPADAANKKLKYTSSDPYAATVSSDGVITALAQGSTDITIEATDGSGVKAQVHVAVDYDREKVSKPKAIVMTDGEVDDMDSLVRLLLYTNEVDIIGIVQSSASMRWKGSEDAPDDAGKQPYRWPGTEWKYEIIDAYGEVYENLRLHASNYPTPNYLKSVTVNGNFDYVGDMSKSTDGSNLIKEAILDIAFDRDTRSLSLQSWGGPVTAARALKEIEDEYKNTPQWETIYNKICDKVVLNVCGLQDGTYNSYIGLAYPDIKVVNCGFGAYAYITPGTITTELQERLSGAWHEENIEFNHGALLDKYVTYGDGTYLEGEPDDKQYGSDDAVNNSSIFGGPKERYHFISEGDSPTYLHLFDNGLREQEGENYGGWAGRFRKQNTTPGNNRYSGASDYTIAKRANASQADGQVENAQIRWAVQAQNDFAGRADWCIADSYEKANHRPSLAIKEGLDITAAPGERVMLNAIASDPDGDKVSVNWWHYYEAGKDINGSANNTPLVINGSEAKAKNTKTAVFTIPNDAKNGDTFHIIATATDNGTHNLSYNQRIIVTVDDSQKDYPTSITASVGSNTIVAGKTAQITVTPEPANAEMPALVYESSDPLAAAVSKDGKITALAQGSTTITVKSVQGNLETSVDITVDYDKAKVSKPRAIVMTDGEVDDMDSLVRLLLYTNEVDLAGIIQTGASLRWRGSEDAPYEAGKHPYRWPGTEWKHEIVDAYAEVYENLRVHDANYPTPNYLKSITVDGNVDWESDMSKSSDGSDLIKKAILDIVSGKDTRSLSLQAWGGPVTAARALKEIEDEYRNTPEWGTIYNTICDKVVLNVCGFQDDTYDKYIALSYPDMKAVNIGFGVFAYSTTNQGTPAMQERLSGAWYAKNIEFNHGALMDKYVTIGDGTYLDGEVWSMQYGVNEELLNNSGAFGGAKERYHFISEGDSPTYFHLLDNGLREQEGENYGGWAGRYAKQNTTNGSGVALTKRYSSARDYVTTERADPSIAPGKGQVENAQIRWTEQLQNDFAGRADWCIADAYEKANHRPGLTIKEGLDITAAPGERVTLNAITSDPDGDKVSVDWWHYYEAGKDINGSEDNTPLVINGSAANAKNTNKAVFTIPKDAQKGDTFHIIVTATDNGEHNLCYNQRVIVTVGDPDTDYEMKVVMSPSFAENNNTLLSNAANDMKFIWVEFSKEMPGLGVTWESSNTDVVTVSGNAKGSITGASLTPKTTGSAVITATADDGSGKKASITVNIKMVIATVVLSVPDGMDKNAMPLSPVTLTASEQSGGGWGAPAVLTPLGSSLVEWSSSDTSVATVTAGGVVTPLKEGTVVIKATALDGGGEYGVVKLTFDANAVVSSEEP